MSDANRSKEMSLGVIFLGVTSLACLAGSIVLGGATIASHFVNPADTPQEKRVEMAIGSFGLALAAHGAHRKGRKILGLDNNKAPPAPGPQ
jgi:hypothetical protein